MLNPFKRYRIDYLLSGGLSAFIIILVTLISLVNYTLTSREIAERTSVYQLELLNELTKKLQIQMQSVEQTSLTITKNISSLSNLYLHNDEYYRLRTQAYQDAVLKEFIYSNADVHSIDLYINELNLPPSLGQVKYYRKKDVEKEPWYDIVKNQDYGWIKEHIIETDTGREKIISFARKIYLSGGEYYGLLNINIKADAVTLLIQGKSTGLNRAVLGVNGNVVTAVGELLMKDDWGKSINTVPEMSGKTRISGRDGQDIFLIWSRSPDMQWIIVETTPWDSITRTVAGSTKRILFIGFISIIIILCFTIIFTRQFLKPVYLLVRSMDSFSIGANIKMPTDYQNEFNHMFMGYQRLIERVDELYELLKEQGKKQRETEIKALQAMINPHFLYNTLDQVNWIAIKAGQTEISHVLSMVGKMFRGILSNGRGFITIEEELNYIELYMQVQRIRLGNRFTWDILAQQESFELWIPKLTLQPFVENSIIHGFHNQPSGHLTINLIQTQDDLLFIISDNGVGLPNDWRINNHNKGGYGIGNVKERLNALFGEAYGVDIRAGDEGGTQVSIRIPILKDLRLFE